MLVVAACNHWHAAMPFLFEKIEDYTELLMPDDVLFPLAAEKLKIDLDDGVKHNYPRFGKALKKIAGLSR